MHKFFRWISTALISCAVMVSSIPVQAGSALPQIVEDKTGSISIDYKDDLDGKKPVNGAEFTFYKIADMKMSVSGNGTADSVASEYKSIISGVEVTPKTDPQQIEDAVVKAYEDSGVEGGKTYRTTTTEEGTAKITDVEIGVYLGVESRAAEGHYASIPVLVTVPQMNESKGLQGWSYDISIYPKPLPLGDLKIEKQLSGNAAEKDREFHFTVIFDRSKAGSASEEYSKKIAYGESTNDFHTAESESAVSSTTSESVSSNVLSNGYNRVSDEYAYTNSDGKSATLKSGESVTLKGGQFVTIKNIPVGTSYTVSEQEANTDGYKTTVKNEFGAIASGTTTVTFVNSKTAPAKSATATPAKPASKTSTMPTKSSAISRIAPKTGDIVSLLSGAIALAAAICLIIVTRKKIPSDGGSNGRTK